MLPLIKCADSNHHDLYCRTGHYTVGGKNFYRKTNALLEASSTKQTPRWHFHDAVFANCIKTHKHFVGLDNLYRLRAQQLRDNYDYLILSYSGGSDSDTVLRSFLNNNIKIDEVWHDTNLKFLEKSNYVLTRSTHNTNNPSEYFLTVLPELQALANNGRTKIHFSDACAEPTTEDYEDSQSFLTIPTFYSIIKRYRYINNYMQSLPYHRVGLISGIDKIIPWYNKTEYGFKFSDNATFCKVPNIEYFFWTPDMPEIVVEQAKTVWRYLLANKKFTMSTMLSIKLSPPQVSRSAGFENIVKKLCYSSWDNTKHQCDKYSLFNAEHVQWYNYYFQHEHFFQTWQRNYRESVQKLDPLFACENKTNFDNDVTKFTIPHKLGDLNWN